MKRVVGQALDFSSGSVTGSASVGTASPSSANRLRVYPADGDARMHYLDWGTPLVPALAKTSERQTGVWRSPPGSDISKAL